MSFRAKYWRSGEVTNLEKLKHIKAYVVICKAGIKNFEVDVMNVFGDQTGDFGCWVAHNIQEGDNVGTSC